MTSGNRELRIVAGDELRGQHVARLQELLPEYRARIDWPGERLAEERTRALRALIAVAQQRSPWHGERLEGIDVAAVTEADIGRMPTMTKADLMDNFDAIVTDPRVTLESCEWLLAGGTATSYLFGEHRVVASGGSSGRRGVFVYGWDAWAACYASIVRFQQRDWASDPTLSGVPRVTAVVGASHSSHMSAALGQTFSSDENPRHLVPVDQQMELIVQRLNQLEPTVLMGYSSYLAAVAVEARAGRLRITPRHVIAISEPLLPETRALLEETWQVPVANGYGMSEGVFTGSCGRSTHLPDDLCIVEPVDSGLEPVPPGSPGSKILVTNLYNAVLPLIRYEVTDELTILEGACECGSSMSRITDPLGRVDDTFVYADDVVVHPHIFRSALGRRDITEYQVRQTEHGAAVRIVGTGIDRSSILSRLEQALASVGLRRPVVTVEVVATIERLPSGKLQRFVGLPATARSVGTSASIFDP